jgi:D-alanyl-D-alanine carboxypeptidase
MPRRTRTAVIATFLALGAGLTAPPGGAAAARPSPDGTRAELQRLLDEVHAAGMPGAFAQVRDGHRRIAVATGVADLRTARAPHPGMRHRIGSVTKTFVATTVLQLAGEGRVRLDAPIGEYLPDLVPAPTGAAVTVRMLLNHTSGIGDYDSEIVRTLDDVVLMGQTTYRSEQLAALGLAAAPTHAPGQGWAYSNTNYVLLGLIIGKVTGHRYSTEVHRRILRPLGLRDTYFEGAEPDIRGPHMAAYVPWPPPDGAPRDFTSYNMTWGDAAGEMVSTAADLNRFFRALLDGRLLSPDLLEQMRTTVDAYGLGIYSVDLPCGPVWGHDGGTIGHLTVSWHSPDGRRQVTLAQNMAFYRNPGQDHPIDAATWRFLIGALCGPQPAGAQPADPRAAGAGTARSAGPPAPHRAAAAGPRLPRG